MGELKGKDTEELMPCAHDEGQQKFSVIMSTSSWA